MAGPRNLITYLPSPLRGADTRPLVVLLPWLRAKPAHVEKYSKLYHDRCHSVVTVKIEPRCFYWPSLALPAVTGLVEYLRNHTPPNQKLLFHSFSIGSYLYAVLLREMLRSPGNYADIAQRTVGQIFDSITVGGLDRMATGSAGAVSKNVLVQKVISSSVMMYFRLTTPWTATVYDEAISAFFDNPMHSAPMMYFYCLNDRMADPESMRRLIDYQIRAGHTVTTKCWNESQHAAHLVVHPKEYQDTLDAFLLSCGTAAKPFSKL